TLHTNTAVGAITRLDDMGIEPFLIASSVIGLLAQRLVRILCPDCREAYRPDENERRLLGVPEEAQDVRFHRPVGCEACNQSGYKGRAGIYELVMVDNELRRYIHDRANEQDLEAYARTKTPSIRAHGRERVLAGETSLEEVLRVTRED